MQPEPMLTILPAELPISWHCHLVTGTQPVVRVLKRMCRDKHAASEMPESPRTVPGWVVVSLDFAQAAGEQQCWLV